MDNLKIDNIEKLLHSEPSERLLLKAIKALKMQRKDRKSRFILFMVCAILGLTVSWCNDTVAIMRDSVDTILNVLTSVFGVIFTGYALLQAFMNKHLLMQLITDTKRENSGEEKSRLQDINENFIFLMLLQIVGIIAAVTIKIVLLCIPNNALFFGNLIVNNVGASLLCIGYFYFNGIVLWRTVAFVSSIFQLFNAYAVTRIIEILDEEKWNK